MERSELTATESEREQQHARDEPYPLTPTRVNGVEFGRVRDLVDIAVDSTGGDLTVWAFAANGMAYVWQLGGGPKAITRRIVLNDGTIVPEKDLDGDTFMHGTFSPSSRAVQFDGSVLLLRYPWTLANNTGSSTMDVPHLFLNVHAGVCLKSIHR